MMKLTCGLIIAIKNHSNLHILKRFECQTCELPLKILIEFWNLCLTKKLTIGLSSLFLFIFSGVSYAQEAYLITNKSPIAVSQSSLKGLEWIDKTGQLNFKDIVENLDNFKNSPQEKSNVHENLWQVYALQNTTTDEVWIDIGLRPNKNALFFGLIKNEILEIKNKSFYASNPYSNFNLFSSQTNDLESRRMLLQIPGNTTAKIFIANATNVTFRNGQKYSEWSRGNLYFEGIILGALIPLLFSSIYYSFLFKDKANTWFSIYLFLTVVFTFIEPTHDGSRFAEFFSKSELYGDEEYLNSTNFFQNLLDWNFVYMSVIFYIFCLHALNIQRDYKNAYRFVVAILIGRCLTVPIYYLCDQYKNIDEIINNLNSLLYPISNFIKFIVNTADIPVAVIFTYAAVRLIGKNVKSANFMAASIIVYFFGVFGLTSISSDLKGTYFAHSNALVLLTVIQNILIWFSLIRTSKDNQDKTIEVVETHNKFIVQQNQTLEVKVKERTHELHLESQKSERLMLNILPQSIATRLKAGDEGISDSYQNATILFSDLVGFTKMSSGKTAEELVFLLNDLFKRFDTRATSLGLEKIKTIGDAYMVAGGLPTQDDTHAIQVTKMALGMYEDLDAFNKEHGMELDMRIGINSGPVVAGVIGHSKFSYDLWGNTVNTASRMESTCLPGKVQVSPSTYEQIKGHFDVQENQIIECKGLGKIMTYFVK